MSIAFGVAAVFFAINSAWTSRPEDQRSDTFCLILALAFLTASVLAHG